MAAGPGKYDEIAHGLMDELCADSVAVVVINGLAGSGFSAKSSGVGMRQAKHHSLILADAFEKAAQMLRADVANLAEEPERTQ